MENEKNKDAQSAQRQSPNQEIANDANNQKQADKTDSGNTTSRADTKPKDAQ
jgi:hypothetical protein